MKLFKKGDDSATKKKKPETTDDGGSGDGKKKRGGGGDGLKTLFANHIEKMLLVVAGLLALFMVYKGFSARSTMEGTKAPDQLRQQADDAERIVSSFDWSAFQAERDREKNFLERSNETQQEVDATDYSIGQLINPPMVPARTLRTDPELLAARDLRVIPGYGPLVTNQQPDESRRPPQEPDAPQRDRIDRPWKRWVSPSGDVTKGVYFNAITAVVPYKEQMAEFAALKNTIGYEEERDQPHYRIWALYRDVLAPGGQPTQDRISSLNLERLQKNWGGRGETTLDPPAKYTHEVLTSDVPPILLGNLPDYARHPKIPNEIDDPQSKDITDSPAVDEPVAPSDDDPFGFAVRPETPQQPDEESDSKPDEAKKAVPEYLLFRYFDTDVKPGYTYRYRLILLMEDPNKPVEFTAPSHDTLDQSVSERLVKEQEKRLPGRVTPFSEPSDPVVVPHGNRVIVAGVNQPSQVAVSSGRFELDEPQAKIMATTFEEDSGASIPVIRDAYRGAVANYIDSVWYWPVLRGNRAQRAENHRFQTDTAVLDIRGGTPLAGTEWKAPGQLLLFDAQGRLTVTDELEDAEKFEATYVPTEEDSGRRRIEPRQDPPSLLDRPGRRGGPR